MNSTASVAVTNTMIGAAGYSWVAVGPGSCFITYNNLDPNGLSGMFTFPPCCGIYTISCFAYSAMSIPPIAGPISETVQVSCVSIPSPTIISSLATGSMCSGPNVTLTALGGTSYTWVPSNSNSTNLIINPSSSVCYSLFTNNVQGCVSMDTLCLSVIPTPTLSYTGDSIVCSGTSIKLGLSGAMMFSLNPPGTYISWDTILITPSLPFTTYTLDGFNLSCWAQNPIVFTTTLIPVPTLTLTNSNSVCVGSSTTFSITGANSYTWLTSPVIYGSTLNIVPLPGTAYLVSGTGNNGCVSTFSAYAIINTTCSDVWPGDANRDGLVSSTDIFEIGLAMNSSGAARTSTSNAWLAQYTTNWTGTVSTGWNKSHADCNGDGTINLSDTLAIHNNFSLTHAFKLSNSSSANSDIHLILPSLVSLGDWNKADVMLGDASTPISQLYGLAFDVNIDQNLLDNNQAYMLYSSSFLNAGNQNIEFRKNNLNNGKIYAASVRVDGTNVSGSGKIGELWFKVDPNATNNTVLNLSVSNSVKIGNTGVVAVLSSGSSSTTVSNSLVKLNENSLFERALSFYPNPANNQVILRNSLGNSVNYSLIDVLGRELLKGEFNQSKTLDVSNLASGAYFIKFESAKQSAYKKLVIEK